MSFNEFLSQAWGDHATQTQLVAERLKDSMRRIENGDQIPALAHLITHVYGEHLGLWDEGVLLLQRLHTAEGYALNQECEKALSRSIASLELASGKRSGLSEFSNSEQIRILMTAASSLIGQGQIDQAQTILNQAFDKAQRDVDQNDPAHRAVAINSNNIACALEERVNRSDFENEIMLSAARAARRHWELAGSWLEVERAEYRLAHSHLKANLPELALEHAEYCHVINHKNEAPPIEMFFAYEALALSKLALNQIAEAAVDMRFAKQQFDMLSPDDQSWCRANLDQLTSALN